MDWYVLMGILRVERYLIENVVYDEEVVVDWKFCGDIVYLRVVDLNDVEFVLMYMDMCEFE